MPWDSALAALGGHNAGALGFLLRVVTSNQHLTINITVLIPTILSTTVVSDKDND